MGDRSMTIWEMLRFILQGASITFKLVPVCVISTLILGFLVGMIQFKKIRGLSFVINIYVTIMRGIPPLIIMYLIYCGSFMGAFTIAFIALTVYHTAYVAEIVRGGLEAIPNGQMQAGESLGLSYFQIMFHIYTPQVLKQIIPALCGQYILLIKDTTLVSVVGVQDIMWRARQIMEHCFKPVTVYIIIGVLYYVLCTIVEFIGKAAERKLKRDKMLKRES